MKRLLFADKVHTITTTRPLVDSITGLLGGVRLESRHPFYGATAVVLTPLQVECLHAWLGHIGFAFAHGLPISTVGSCRLSADAEAMPVTQMEGNSVVVQAILIRRGNTKAYLAPEQVEPIRRQLEHVALEFLHDHGWGGENALDQ